MDYGGALIGDVECRNSDTYCLTNIENNRIAVDNLPSSNRAEPYTFYSSEK